MWGVILPQEVDQSSLPGNGCLYTIGKLHSILSLLLKSIDINVTQETKWAEVCE